MQDFTQFNLPPKMMQSLERMQFKTPTPIQAQAIPLALAGRDVLGSAQTGTGKTGAFGIPLITKLMEHVEDTALVLTPTRELAAQVMATLQQLIPVPNIKTALLIGGEPMPKQFRQLQNRPRLIVGTPGRVNDHLERQTLDLKRTRFLVLDETDRMLDMGFGVQLDRIAKHLPKQRQTLMFSATMPDNITKLSAKYLHNPERISVGSVNKPITRIEQELIETPEGEKYNRLVEQLNKRDGTVIIFVKTKFGADRLATKLVKAGMQADAIHGDLKQSKRDRVIREYREKKFRILVATDVASRGLDIPHIEHVINYDLPQAPEDYIHRIGRTARAGAEGSAVNLLTPAETGKWYAIQKLINPQAKRPENKLGPRGGSAPRSRSSSPFASKSWSGKPSGFGNKPNGGGGSRREGRPGGHAPKTGGGFKKPFQKSRRARSAA